MFGLPRPARPTDTGFLRWTDSNGKTWTACTCWAEWFSKVEAECVRRGYVRQSLDVAQVVGTYIKSGKTHWGGGTGDIWQTSREIDLLIRECGGVGNIRTRAQGFAPHNHVTLNGCEHEHPTAAGQVVDVIIRRMNGLLGRARGRDTDPRPKVWRTWRQGLEWLAQNQTDTPVIHPVPVGSATVRVVFWNIGAIRWFGPWADRSDGICANIVYAKPDLLALAECLSSEQSRDIMAALGPNFRHIVSEAGIDVIYNQTILEQTRESVEYDLHAQARHARVSHFRVVATGHRFSHTNTHMPAKWPAGRIIAGRNLVKLLAQVDDARLVTGDFNAASHRVGPIALLEKAGFRFIRTQVKVENGGLPEFPGQGKWLGNIATKTGDAIRITSGKLHLTSPKFSDHRLISCDVELRP